MMLPRKQFCESHCPTPTLMGALFGALCWTLCLLSIAPSAKADTNEQPEMVSGLAVFLQGSSKHVATHASWSGRTNSPLTMSGDLNLPFGGEYQFAVWVNGEVQLSLDTTTVIGQAGDRSGWFTSQPMELDAGTIPIQIRFRSSREPNEKAAGRFSVFWRGPGFTHFEPIPSSALATAADSITNHDEGRRLARALRCDACHSFSVSPGNDAPLSSPELGRAAGVLRSSWVHEFLQRDEGSREGRGAMRRLHASLSEKDAAAAAAYLGRSGNSTDQAETKPNDKLEKEGRELFLSVGCIACHRIDGVGSDSLFNGGDLSSIGDKRPSEFFARWLKSPQELNSNHRMPVFDLTNAERKQIAAFLSSRKSPDPRTKKSEARTAADLERGKAVVAREQCQACHRSGRGQNDVAKVALGRESDWKKGCDGEATQSHPGYELSANEMSAIRGFASLDAADAFAFSASTSLIEESNCIGCHAREQEKGIAGFAPDIAKLGIKSVHAIVPPSLNAVGDKLTDKAIRDAVSGKAKGVRPWLAVQMPQFAFDRSQVDAVAEQFALEDRLPDAAATKVDEIDSFNEHSAGRLVGANGFGCTSCHAVGNMRPKEVKPGAEGPELKMLGSRVRKVWFDRWVRNPARIVPNMEMPSVQIAIPGLMDRNLDKQLNAIWTVLNRRRWQPPDPDAVRIVRHSGRDADGRAHVLTDVLRTDRSLIKPFVVGLANRHNVLFDFERGGLAGWWTGDVARQRTQGKTWFWEPGGVAVTDGLPSETGKTDIRVRRKGDADFVTPVRVGQGIAELDGWRHIEGGVEFWCRLRFASDSNPTVINVRQQIQSIKNGWRRTVRVEHVPENIGEVEIQLGRAAEFVTASLTDGTEVAIKDEAVRFGPNQSKVPRGLRIDYVSDRGISLVPEPDPISVRPGSRRLDDVVPGFEVVQLGAMEELMPTALAWSPTGDLLVASLKGRVWRFRDRDKDGVEDEAVAISDELAAPYGIHAGSDYVDVVTKYGVVRLSEFDDSGHATRHEIVAAGWGHTDDYHDWAVGLPRDSKGNYYLAIPCQQDDRSQAAAKLRGTVVRLEPRKGDAKNPRRFSIKQISLGHRFPMGIARNTKGQLVVTDNQGNFNPFNELNLVRPEAHFGFVNKIDRDKRPPALAPPAINIPHPWTRSVNGICFLQSAPGTGSGFGLFDGHLIGCEYDTRRLIRMSFETVNGVVQGAAYPFSRSNVPAAKSFLGPVACAVSPDGELYVGGMRDSGWGGGNNIGAITRLKFKPDSLPGGIAEVSVTPDGFRIRFTRAISKEAAARKENYRVESFRRISTPIYGGDDVDRRVDPIESVSLADDGKSVAIQLNQMRAGFVYHVRCTGLGEQADSGFFPAEAFYTVHELPRN